MKKIIFISAFLMIFSMCFSVSAMESDGIVINIENANVIFDANSQWTFQEQQVIAQKITSEENEPFATYGLTCTLFGHKYTLETVQVITHNVYGEEPKCLKEVYNVSTCSRCDYIEEELLSTVRISCCP
ncbi:MAG: hypothetical protein IJW55_09380 [Clostridia bacterium]|nr:hypothetical protein [Clostridia bacterium]